MQSRHVWIVAVLLVLLSISMAVFAYYEIPGDRIASHWNAQGEVNGYMSKLWGLSLFPIGLAVICLIFLIIPRVDPLKRNIKKFRNYYDLFLIVTLLFLLYIQGLTTAWNIGFAYDMTFAIVPATSVLFYVTGVLMEHAKRNWFVGIRTPWTLSSNVVWRETHKAGGKWFKILAVYMLSLLLLGNVLKDYFIILFLVPTLGVAFGLFVYSYWLYYNLKKD
ncbi:MAG: SdpI family protein [Candidatus Diapherotrites archaeon]|nr:SdpI family protein [Candidatus Diapherotrites archaeon]